MILRLVLATATVATVALGGAAHVFACGNSTGESYAAAGGPTSVYGASARIAQVSAFDVLNGHIAAWVGVGGPGRGANGSAGSLQVGYSGFPGPTGSDIYYEIARPGRYPTYHQVSTGVAVGTYTEMTVLEMHGHPNWWRVWVNHQPASPPIHLPNSHDRWTALATTESWDPGTGSSCNAVYRFRHLSIARAPGGDWQQLSSEAVESAGGATS